MADPTRLRLWWRNGGKRRRKSRQSLLLSERLSNATMARRHGYYSILRRHLNTLAQGESLTQGKSKLAFLSPNSVVCSVCPSARFLHGWVISFPRLSKTKRRLSDRPRRRRRVNSFHPLSVRLMDRPFVPFMLCLTSEEELSEPSLRPERGDEQ